MAAYPVLEHAGRCASVSTQREPTGRWMAFVTLERDADYARLKVHPGEAQRVPNDYPSEEQAVLAAYEHARALIAKENVLH